MTLILLPIHTHTRSHSHTINVSIVKRPTITVKTSERLTDRHYTKATLTRNDCHTKQQNECNNTRTCRPACSHNVKVVDMNKTNTRTALYVVLLGQ